MNDIIIQYRDKYQSEDNIQKKFDLLSNIIQLENEEGLAFRTYVYQDIKAWFELYLTMVQNKKFSYDEFLYDKIINKIELVTPLLRIQLVNYLIRLLKKEFYVDEIILYENYKKDQELLVLKEEKKYILFFLKSATKNFLNICITLIISILIFSLLWLLLEDICEVFSTEVISFVSTNYFNYMVNLIDSLFFHDEIKKIDSIWELSFFISIKLYFFLLISYFMIKEISIKVNSL